MTSTDLDSLDIPRIRRALHGFPIGSELLYLPEVDSTNRFARDLGPGRLRHGLVVLTDFQRAGRGRNGRGWIADPGTALLASTVLTPRSDSPPTYLVMIAGLAVVDAIAEVSGRAAQLKWPNDVLVSGRKVCGILAEHAPDERYYVIGIGVNVAALPNNGDVSPEMATSLNLISGRRISRTDFAVALFKSLNMWYRMLTHDPGSIFEEWAIRLAVAGTPLEVRDSSGTWQGVGVGLQKDGALLVQNEQGSTQALYAADVSVRSPLYGQGDGE